MTNLMNSNNMLLLNSLNKLVFPVLFFALFVLLANLIIHISGERKERSEEGRKEKEKTGKETLSRYWLRENSSFRPF